MQNPFTTTFSKAPEQTYIETDDIQEIIENFSYDSPTESVYKITGVRGSGKTVNLSKVEEAYSSEANAKRGWLVCRLSPARDLLKQFAALLHKEKFGKRRTAAQSINVSASVMGTGAGFGYSSADDSDYFDIGIEIAEMLSAAQQAKKKILIGIDEVSKTPEMVEFASEFGSWLRAGFPVYLVCTGLYENMRELSNVKNLTFFQRARTIQTQPLNEIRMAEMYKRKLNVDTPLARELSAITKGYAFAFQELGNLYFREQSGESLEDVGESMKSALYANSYEKIWEELSPGDRKMVAAIATSEEPSRKEVMAKLGDTAANYPMYRQRLLERGIIHAPRGYVSLALPFFGDFVKEYCLFE